MASSSQGGITQLCGAGRLGSTLCDLELRLAEVGSDTESVATGRSTVVTARDVRISDGLAIDVVCSSAESGAADSIDLMASQADDALSSSATSCSRGGITLAFDKLYAELVVSRPCFGEV